jgi:hypothetical protein
MEAERRELEMGSTSIVAFGVLWSLMASVLVWGVLSGGRRNRRRSVPGPAWTDELWVVVDDLPGAGPEVESLAELVLTAALAARGVHAGAADRRVEVVAGAGGAPRTRLLVRRRVLTGGV